MIGTFLYKGQGLGNQLWSYYTVRLLAIRNNCQFVVFAKKAFKGKNFIELDFGYLVSYPSRSQPEAEIFPPFSHYFSEQQTICKD